MLVGNELLSEFHRLCEHAKERFWVVSPFLGDWNKLEKIIGTILSRKGIDIKLITDISNISVHAKRTIEKFLSIGKVKTLDMLHAKLYIIDGKVLVTSANLSETAFCYRHEIGNIIDSDEIIPIFENWFNKAESVTFENIKYSNFNNYNPDGDPEPKSEKLWHLGNNATSKKITEEMIHQVYEIVKYFYKKDILITSEDAIDGIKKLMESGWDENSAKMYILNFDHMLRGRVYKRTMNRIGTYYYLKNIYKDFGMSGLNNAINAYKKHIEYNRNPSIGNRLSYTEKLIERVQKECS